MADSPDAPSSEHVKPREVPYCGFCSLPPEYCEFGPTLDKCKEWLSKNDKVLYAILYNTLEDQLYATSLGGDSKPEDDKKKAKEAAKIEKQMQKKMQSRVIIKRIERTKRKCVTSVFGLENFDVDLKKAAKLFANKFACGSSVTKNNQGNDEIVVQGDVSDEIFDLILEHWPIVPDDNIDLVEDKKKGK
ncbi:Translation machinery-associated protein 22 [Dissophora globulifera]|uniref:Translation machinery-associated protein 22 n=1 Tax=Dissophora globulifera TaxID=979702 RepID=A0A9P6RTD0_9FUNG|nr:Translation machinery-associated protein 22 [Dissophora globulifera]KAG0329151.1 Translation machinery-associated protein 22 [Dissophora globulifera]